MPRFTCLVLFVFAYSNGQVYPFGSSPVPFAAAADVFRPTSTPVNPTLLPFGQNPQQFPGNPYNNPYYNKYNPAASPNVPILSFSNTQDVQGSYAFSFTTADGKQVQESGYLKDAYVDNAGEPQGIQVVQGSYAYIAPDGTPIQVTYVADENGYRPSGVHIPSDGKGAAPYPFPNTDKDGKPRFVDPFNKRFNQYDNRYNPYDNRYNQYNPYDNRYNSYDNRYNPYDPYHRNNGRNYYGNNRYDPYRYNSSNDPGRYYQNGSRYNPNWYNSHPGYVPLSQEKFKEDIKKD